MTYPTNGSENHNYHWETAPSNQLQQGSGLGDEKDDADHLTKRDWEEQSLEVLYLLIIQISALSSYTIIKMQVTT